MLWQALGYFYFDLKSCQELHSQPQAKITQILKLLGRLSPLQFSYWNGSCILEDQKQQGVNFVGVSSRKINCMLRFSERVRRKLRRRYVL